MFPSKPIISIANVQAMKLSKSTLNNFGKKLSEPDARFYAFATFLTIVFFTGGGSRDDVQSLVFLRPLAILFGAYALTCMTRGQWTGRLFPLYISLALMLVMVAQSIPLPPSVWTELPERKIFMDIANLAGIEQPWRPLTLSPSRTFNSLFSLAIPISAMMLYLNLDEVKRKQAVAVIISLVAISAILATLQLAGSPRGPLYFYNITNNGSAVGLMANRNHQAVLLAVTIVMLGWYGASHAPAARLAVLKFYTSVAAIFVLVPLIFITGSRAGLLLMAPALIIAMILIYNGRYIKEGASVTKKLRRKKKQGLISRQMILMALILAVVGIAILSIYFSRSLAYDRLFGGGKLEELRLQVLPTLFKMLGDFSPWGSGFGTFEHVYKIYETHDLLRPTYLNQAHNDWLQFPIEGGFPAVVIAMLAVSWFGFQFIRLFKNWPSSHYSKYTAIMAATVMILFLGASVGDYPLRVPAIIAIFAVMGCVLNDNIQLVQRRAIQTE